MGYKVFDCDSEAKRLMDTDPEIKKRLVREIAPDTVVDGKINRPVLAGHVFNSPEKLAILNNISHTAVKNALNEWIKVNSSQELLFVETALLYASGLNRIVDSEWRVEAPVDLRVERVMLRNNTSAQKVMERINAQAGETIGTEPYPALSRITNDNRIPLLPQIHALLTH